MPLILEKAKIKNLSTIQKILKEENLVYEDIQNKEIEFFLAYDNSKFVGIIGLESFKDVALLRSMVVKKEYRNKNYGQKICDEFINYLKKQNIKEIYLLTTTAKDFFIKIGFEIKERNTAPEEIKTTTEFSTLCPLSAICMHKIL